MWKNWRVIFQRWYYVFDNLWYKISYLTLSHLFQMHIGLLSNICCPKRVVSYTLICVKNDIHFLIWNFYRSWYQNKLMHLHLTLPFGTWIITNLLGKTISPIAHVAKIFIITFFLITYRLILIHLRKLPMHLQMIKILPVAQTKSAFKEWIP